MFKNYASHAESRQTYARFCLSVEWTGIWKIHVHLYFTFFSEVRDVAQNQSLPYHRGHLCNGKSSLKQLAAGNCLEGVFPFSCLQTSSSPHSPGLQACYRPICTSHWKLHKVSQTIWRKLQQYSIQPGQIFARIK